MAPCLPVQQSDSPVMYCADCQETLSIKSLLIDTHWKHTRVTLEESCKVQLEKIKEGLRNLEPKIRKAGDTGHVSAAKKKLEDMYSKTRESIVHHYEDLWKLLENNQTYTRFLLEAERENLQKSLDQLEVDASNFQEKTEKMMEDIQRLRKIKKPKCPIDLLGELGSLEMSLEKVEEFYSSAKEKTFDCMRMNALEQSVKNIVQKNNELLPRPWEFSEVITFLESRTHQELEVSTDGSQVLLKGLSTLKSNKHTAMWYSAVASQSFKKGQHYWEVEVRRSQSWSVGVVELGWEKNRLSQPLGRDQASWALESDEGDLTALNRNKLSQVGSHSVHRLGVYLDYGKGQMKIYDVNTGSMLHSFSARFKKPVCPAVSLKAMTSCTAQLKICSITQDDQNSVLCSQSEGTDSGAYTNSGESRALSEQSQ